MSKPFRILVLDLDDIPWGLVSSTGEDTTKHLGSSAGPVLGVNGHTAAPSNLAAVDPSGTKKAPKLRTLQFL